MSEKGYCVVLTTTDSQSEADLLARLLVAEKSAACVQIMPITSVYSWQDVLHQDAEFLLLIKTRSERYSQVEASILKHHSYEVPEIILLPVDRGYQPYLQWMDVQTGDDEPPG
jgi:periplasmic divalent cation tolerance protein